jgi:hypothetical protein
MNKHNRVSGYCNLILSQLNITSEILDELQAVTNDKNGVQVLIEKFVNFRTEVTNFEQKHEADSLERRNIVSVPSVQNIGDTVDIK